MVHHVTAEKLQEVFLTRRRGQKNTKEIICVVATPSKYEKYGMVATTPQKAEALVLCQHVNILTEQNEHTSES